MASASVDTVTLEIIENTLRMVRHEMDAVMFRASISPMIRETHDTYPLVADRNGRMLVGQFGSYLTAFFEHFDEELRPGDVIVQNDPYLCGGSISHTPDVLILRPVFHEERPRRLHEPVRQPARHRRANVRVDERRGAVDLRGGDSLPAGEALRRGASSTALLVQVLARNSRAPEAAVADVMASARQPPWASDESSSSANGSDATPTSPPATRCSNGRAARCNG